MQRRGQVNLVAPLKYAAAALLLYGVVGVAVQLRLLPLLLHGSLSWVGLAGEWPLSLPWLQPFQAHFDGLPWLPWAAWLVGVGLLAFPSILTGEDRPGETSTLSSALPRWVIPAAVLALLLVGGYARLMLLWPQSAGISQRPYDDEGVYAGTSQLFLQGILPYRDYFFAHPPLAAISYAPAMAYRLNEWGSPTSFMMGRYLSVAYSLVTLALIFFIGVRLAGVWGGTIAGALWALDERVIEINRKIMLEGPMVLLSCAALLLYLCARPTLVGGGRTDAPRRPLLLLSLAGACAAASALTKIAGVACLLAIIVDIIWLALSSRHTSDIADIATDNPKSKIAPQAQLLALLTGALGAVLLVAGPFLLLAPSPFVRDVFLFQVLRPADGLIDVAGRMADLSATLGGALTLLSAALGFAVLTLGIRGWGLGVREEPPIPNLQPLIPNPWRVAVLWTFFSVLLFTYSRSFYGHYYIQLAAPLCLLGAGVSLFPGLVRQWTGRAVAQYAGLLPAFLLLLISLPLLLVQWSAITQRQEDRIFEIVARYATDAVPPGTPILTTDEQFNFLAARPPSHNATGYLIDSYGHMIALGLGLDERSWGDLWADVFMDERSDDVYAIIRRPRPQADFLDRASLAPLIVVHDRGFSRLTPSTVEAIEQLAPAVERQARYTIYRVPE